MERIEPAIYQPDIATPPGETVAELLREHEMSILDFAQRVGLDEDESILLLRGELELSPELAESLSEVFELPVHFWQNLETNYRINLDRIESEDAAAEIVEFARSFPLSEMARLGWIKNAKTPNAKAISLLDFFGILSPQMFTATGVYRTAFRKSPTKIACNYALAAWLRFGELKAAEVQTGIFDEAGIRGQLADLRALTRLTPDEFGPRVISICRQFGVAVVFVPLLPKCYASGAAYKLGDKFVIQLSLRHKTDDHFWFSLFHELGHVILHLSKNSETFLDDFVTRGDEREKQADEFASSILISKQDFLSLVMLPKFTKEKILEFSDQIGVAPGVVVGRLQHDRLLSHDRFKDLKQPIASLE